MIIIEWIYELCKMNGNYIRGSGDIYISLSNIEETYSQLERLKDIQGILITPFLIDVEKDVLYELHYYEFELETKDKVRSYFIEFEQGNILPEEILNGIKPKAIVSAGDIAFFANALMDYFSAMKKMRFIFDKKMIPELSNSSLFFRIY